MVQQPSQTAQSMTLVIRATSSHESDSSVQHSSVEPALGVHECAHVRGGDGGGAHGGTAGGMGCNGGVEGGMGGLGGGGAVSAREMRPGLSSTLREPPLR